MKKKFQLIICGLFFPIIALAGSWNSPAVGQAIPCIVTESPLPLKDASGKYMTVVYLEQPGFDKIGQNTCSEDVQWLLAQGYRVIELNYQNNPKAIAPAINLDIIAINDALNSGRFCGAENCSAYRSYILFEGYRIARDIPYFKDDPSVYNWPDGYTEGDSLYMDIIYPANASIEIPTILSFSYSNSSHNNRHQRLFLGYTLSMFDDSFLEGTPANGMAWAIADHPKYCDWGQGKPTGGSNKAYGSFETNPDAAQKVKSAIRTLRSLGKDLGLSRQIGIYGFSRSSTVGSLAVGDKSVEEFEIGGLHSEESDDIQAAALGSGVFDYTFIYNTQGDGDGSLESKCPVVWGALESNRNLWEKMGATYLISSSASAPVLFFYNSNDEHYYQEQIHHFKTLLEEKGVRTDSLVNYASGHAVPKDTASLAKMYAFFKQFFHTTDAHHTSSLPNTYSVKNTFNLTNGDIHFCYTLPIDTQEATLQIYDLYGHCIDRMPDLPTEAGTHTFSYENHSLRVGIYFYILNLQGENSCQRPSGKIMIRN